MNGKEYCFLSLSDFVAQRQAGHFLEWAIVHGHLYGTRQSDVEALLSNGNDVLLEIDWQGAQQVAEKIPETIRVFILPPSLDDLRKRLIMRGQDDAHTVANRVAAADEEMSHADEAHYQIVNVDFDRARHELEVIIAKESSE
jgi:guanylate kinase